MTSLIGGKVAISISDAPDRERLGYPEQEVTRVLYSVCTAIIRAGASVVYSGDLRSGGYTDLLFRFLAGAYAGADVAPFEHVLPEPDVRRLSFDALFDSLSKNRGVAKTTFVLAGSGYQARRSNNSIFVDSDAGGRLLSNDLDLEGWLSKAPVSDDALGYSQARRYVATDTNGRVAMGGKMGLLSSASDRYSGAGPGIIEEINVTLQANKPVVLLGAFGGATRDAAIELGLLDASAKVPRGEQLPSYVSFLSETSKLRSKIPGSCIGKLQAIANDDRAEFVALSSVDVLKGWSLSH